VNAAEKTGVHLGLVVHGSVHQTLALERKNLLTSFWDLLEVLDICSSGGAEALAQEACVGVKGERV